MFTWIPIFKELATTILKFEDRQDEILLLIKHLANSGLVVISTKDKASEGHEIELAEVDPFTFFSNFNRRLTLANRRILLAGVKKAWNLVAPVPDDFTGVPTVSAMSSWFFPFARIRTPEDVPLLWALARETVTKSVETFDRKILEKCFAIKGIGFARPTIGMFWLNPTEFLAADSQNRRFFAGKGIKINENTADGYFEFLQKVEAQFGKNFPLLSQEAHDSVADPAFVNLTQQTQVSIKNSHASKRQYWWLNANPKIWDFNAVEVGETQVYTSYNEKGNKRQRYKYFEQVKPGDLVVGYVT
jgi:hypothetical protein